MKRLSVAEVHSQKTAELGLDNTALDLTSVEGIAGALRRSASFLCPCSSATLIRSVLRPLRGLVDDLDAFKRTVEDTLEAMVAHGDLFEQREITDQGERHQILLYAAPPSFVCRQSGVAVLLGIASDQLSALPEELEKRIEYVNHVRHLPPQAGENLFVALTELGIVKLSAEAWLKSPSVETPAEHVQRLDRMVDSAPSSLDIPGLLLLDAERPVNYYRGRWVEPKSHAGRFVARRAQAYGSDLWCYVEVQGGQPRRFIDLPSPNSRWRGCDEAWHLQMAIDAQRAEPQRYRILSGSGKKSVVQFFSPVPMWARRRWDAVGEPAPSSGCLFAYKFNDVELFEELRFARETLWLKEIPKE